MARRCLRYTRGNFGLLRFRSTLPRGERLRKAYALSYPAQAVAELLAGRVPRTARSAALYHHVANAYWRARRMSHRTCSAVCDCKPRSFDFPLSSSIFNEFTNTNANTNSADKCNDNCNDNKRNVCSHVSVPSVVCFCKINIRSQHFLFVPFFSLSFRSSRAMYVLTSHYLGLRPRNLDGRVPASLRLYVSGLRLRLTSLRYATRPGSCVLIILILARARVRERTATNRSFPSCFRPRNFPA